MQRTLFVVARDDAPKFFLAKPVVHTPEWVEGRTLAARMPIAEAAKAASRARALGTPCSLIAAL